MGLLEQKKTQAREKRLNTLSSYIGDINPILEDLEKNDVKQRIRTFSQSTFDEIIYVLQAINNIEVAAIVIHGPSGCSSAQLHFYSEGSSSRWFVSNLNERDTIMGGDDKLREVIMLAYRRYKPKVIFVVATPVVAINNDDISSVVQELEEELQTKILPIYSDGFKSKTSINGYDLVLHAIAEHLVNKENTQVKDNFINLISVSENNKDIKEMLSLLDNLGVSVNLIPKFSDIEGLAKASKAKITVALNQDESNFLAQVLEESYDVPFIKTSTPVGIERTVDWLLKIGAATGLTREAKALINSEVDKINKLIKEKPLQGVKVYIDLPSQVAVSMITLIKEFGGEVVGLTVDQVDKLNKKEFENIKDQHQIRVANGQPFELVNLLYKIKPDLYVGGLGKTIWATKIGIPSVSVANSGVYGFNGARTLLANIKKVLINNSIENKKHPYENSWLSKSPNWYIKQEVK